MPLTPEEIAFLGPTVAEYSDVKTGPAWTILDQRKISYRCLIWLMEAYQFVDPPRFVSVTAADGTITELLQFGRPSDTAPECPWPDSDAANRRNQEIEPEVQALREVLRKARTS
jgi:hypothetical protein